MALYNIDFQKIIKGLLPIALRSLQVLAEVLASPFIAIKTRIYSYRLEKLAAMGYNAQHPNLQRLLNDKYDDTDRRIRVYDNTAIVPIVVYPDNEINPVSIPVVLYPQLRYSYMGFIVEIPQNLSVDTRQQIIKTVNIYKFTGTYYQIITNE